MWAGETVLSIEVLGNNKCFNWLISIIAYEVNYVKLSEVILKAPREVPCFTGEKNEGKMGASYVCHEWA